MTEIRIVDPSLPECRRCDGCGKIANSDDGEAWTFWANLKPGEDLAVQLGVVKPIECPDCKGTGRKPSENP